MAARTVTRRVLAALILLALAALPGCKKQGEPVEPAPAPSEPNAQMPAVETEAVDADADKDFRILYAGHPGSEREGDFIQFLRRHFGTVETGDLEKFAEAQCDGFDVTILDYDGEGFEAPRPRISEQFSRPLVTVGVPGGLMCSQWRLKTGYL